MCTEDLVSVSQQTIMSQKSEEKSQARSCLEAWCIIRKAASGDIIICVVIGSSHAVVLETVTGTQRLLTYGFMLAPRDAVIRGHERG
jgi:DUF1009 family protein